MFLGDGKTKISPALRQPQGIGHVLLVVGLSAGLLISYSFTHSTQQVYHNDMNEFNGSFWMGLVILTVAWVIVFARNWIDMPLQTNIRGATAKLTHSIRSLVF